jgi:uncharacterized protein YbcI
MDEPRPTMARQIARAVGASERERRGRPPVSASVALGGATVVATLFGALSPAERAATQTAEGAALVQEYYRALFASASGPLRLEIGRITGAAVQGATADVQGMVGTVVQVFLLAGSVPAETWSGTVPGD